ncbi:hypothetical protein SLEP1_g9491 [Rubroshorea leprosula]|uniref:Uncharacterized protein n=1 Tax=Rubroshorea leprosula TaxID=152421 RepID=A0AAV5IGA8_9ROSI|nr:hypothetical protein SLEP1_g9491 [Rubroshorea leprosula]
MNQTTFPGGGFKILILWVFYLSDPSCIMKNSSLVSESSNCSMTNSKFGVNSSTRMSFNNSKGGESDQRRMHNEEESQKEEVTQKEEVKGDHIPS